MAKDGSRNRELGIARMSWFVFCGYTWIFEAGKEWRFIWLRVLEIGKSKNMALVSAKCHLTISRLGGKHFVFKPSKLANLIFLSSPKESLMPSQRTHLHGFI